LRQWIGPIRRRNITSEALPLRTIPIDPWNHFDIRWLLFVRAQGTSAPICAG
jgi:hypothetical protein